MQEGPFIYHDPWEHWTHSEIHSNSGFGLEEHWGEIAYSYNLCWLQVMSCLFFFFFLFFSICLLFSILPPLQNISSNIQGITGDEAIRQNLKSLVKSLSRLLWRQMKRWKYNRRLQQLIGWLTSLLPLSHWGETEAWFFWNFFLVALVLKGFDAIGTCCFPLSGGFILKSYCNVTWWYPRFRAKDNM